MEKVKLTREQAEAIKEYIGVYSQSGLVNRHEGKWMSEELKSLNYLSTDEIARALYIGYEVEPEFNVGDWVTFEDGRVSKITKIEKHLIRTDCYLGYERKNGEKAYMNTVPGHLRHATPEEIAEEKERRWWAKHGREPWELRKGDSLIKSGESHYPCIVCEAGDFNVRFTDGYFLGKSRIKKTYRVFCFADDRKDVDNE